MHIYIYFPGLHKLNIIAFIIEGISNTCYFDVSSISLDIIPAVLLNFEIFEIRICMFYAILMRAKKFEMRL